MVAQVPPRGAGQVLAGSPVMCVACGCDLPAEPGHGQQCDGCGSPRVLLPDSTADQPGLALGTLHLRRHALRKRWAMLVARGPAGCTLLLHNGRTVDVVPDAVPAVVEPDLGGMPGGRPYSPAGRMLRYAVAVSAGAITLPWTAEQILDHAFGLPAAAPWQARAVALDVLTLGQPQLLARCLLGEPELTWLRLVHAARTADVTGLVAAAAALPAGRYRPKIAVLAAFVERIAQLPAAAGLATGLAAFAPSEPLAGVLQRRLGLVASDPGQDLRDLRLLAASLGAPGQIRQLAGLAGGDAVEPAALALLGPGGRVAAAHRGAGCVVTGPDLDRAPLPVVDDLVDRGLVDRAAVAACGRGDADRSYLLARVAPAELTDEQVDQVGHREEKIRRRLLAGSAEVGEQDRDAAFGRHCAALGLLWRNRPQDVSLDDVLVNHRAAAESIIKALNAAEAGAGAATLLDGTMLADRTTWSPLVTILGSERLRPPDREFASRYPAFFEWLALVVAREHLFLADWEAGVDAARQCLDLATAEPVRDEAQNLLACGLHNLGDNVGALQALQTAIEGEYSVALLANIGVVAGHLDPELAATHLARIVREAPTAAMRMSAARCALAMWVGDRNIWQGEGDGGRRLPTVLREPLRSVVVGPISLDDFRAVMAALADFDEEWLRARGVLDGSPHRGSLDARYFLAKAQPSFLPVVDVLGTVRDWQLAPPWIVQERDKLVEQTIGFLVEHIDDPDNAAGVIARALVEKVGGLVPRTRVQLALLAVATLTYHVSEQRGEIADAIVALFHDSERQVQTLEEADRELASNLVELCVRRITYNLQQARALELDALVEPYNLAVRVLDHTVRGSSAWFEARRQIADVIQQCRRAKAELKPWLRRVEHADLRELVMDFMEHCSTVEIKAEHVLGG